MKKKKVLIIALVLVALLIAFIGGQVYAKYVTKLTGRGTAEIATWSFKVNGGKEEIRTINLASTCDNDTLADNKIAPGTSGSFNIVLDATGSDVGIDYTVRFTQKSGKPNNLKFMYEGKEYNSIQDLQNVISGTINAKDKNKVKTLNIEWKWEYETGTSENDIAQNDILDTQDSVDIPNYEFDVTVTATQVEPQA